MTTSNIKKLNNEMTMLEEISDRYISCENYYVIKILMSVGVDKEIQEWTRELLSKNKNHQPLVVYTFGNEICMLFSCLEEGEHYLSGSHQRLCSEYASIYSRMVGNNVECKIVEMKTHTQVFTYFSWKVFNNSRRKIIDLSDGQITSKDIMYRTSSEIIDTLKEIGVEWEECPNDLRYGVFYKLRRKRKGKVVISSLSEPFDSRENKKYISFLFG